MFNLKAFHVPISGLLLIFATDPPKACSQGSIGDVKTSTTISVAATLLQSDGKPVNLRSTSSPVLLEERTDIRFLNTSMPVHKQEFLTLKIDAGSAYGTGHIQKLPVPAYYYAVGIGKWFGPVHADSETTSLVLREAVKEITLTGRVVDQSGKGLPEAHLLMVEARSMGFAYGRLLRKLEDSNYLQEVFDRTGGAFDAVGGYMAKTDESGRFHIKGHYLPPEAQLFASAKDHGTLSMYWLNLAKGDVLPLEARGGEVNAGTLVLVREAKVTFTLKAPVQAVESDLYPSVQFTPGWADHLNLKDPQLYRTWIARNQHNGERFTRTAPAGVKFRLEWPVHADTDKDPKPPGYPWGVFYVDTPLQPGETRDFGLIYPQPRRPDHPLQELRDN